MRMLNTRLARSAAAGVLLLLMTAGAGAQQPEHGHGSHAGREAPYSAHYDSQFNHNHYYTTRGVEVARVPGRPYVVARGGVHYYYSGGVWYAPRGPSYVVVGPPVGVFVPVLPPFYTTVWFGGVPYYYANDTYYVWHDAQSGYEVVEPPGSEQAASTEAPPSDDLYIYPQKEQSQDQQASDKYECHKWASAESGFDPTQSGGGVASDQQGG